MSVQVISWVIQHAPSDLNATEMLVALMLAEHADSEGGMSYPSVETLCRETRCSRASVYRALTSLADRRVIEEQVEESTRTLKIYCFPTFRESQNENAESQIETHDSQIETANSQNENPLTLYNHPMNHPTNRPTPPISPAPKFEEFWALFPRGRGNRADSRAAWLTLKPEERIAVMDRLPLFVASYQWQKENHRYVMHAQRWLKKRGWEDDVPQEQSPNGAVRRNVFAEMVREVDESRSGD